MKDEKLVCNVLELKNREKQYSFLLKNFMKKVQFSRRQQFLSIVLILYFFKMHGCAEIFSPHSFAAFCQEKQAPTKRIGEYLINFDKKLGNGSYSNVYEGINKTTSEKVAAKVINLQPLRGTQLTKLLYQETSIFGQLSHDNVVRCRSMMKSENNCYIIMELCDGINLEKLIRQQKNNKNSHLNSIGFPDGKMEKIIFSIFHGLKYLSSRNIVHRDLKSANILVESDGHSKITDFGFAVKAFSDFNDQIFVGTPLYTPPQAFIEQKYGPKTDIWSFGVIIYEMLFRETPLGKSNNEKQFMQNLVELVQIDSHSHPYISSHPDLIEVLEGCLEPNYYERWSMEKLSSCQYIRGLESKFRKEKLSMNKQSPPSEEKVHRAFNHLHSLMGEKKLWINRSQSKTESKIRSIGKGCKTQINQSLKPRNLLHKFGLEKGREGPKNIVLPASGLNLKSNYYSVTFSPRNPPGPINSFQTSQITVKTSVQQKGKRQNYDQLSNSNIHFTINRKSETEKDSEACPQGNLILLPQTSHKIKPFQFLKNQIKRQSDDYSNKFSSSRAESLHQLIYAPLPQQGQVHGDYFEISHLLLAYYEIYHLLHYCRLLYRVICLPKYRNSLINFWLQTIIVKLNKQILNSRQYSYLKMTVQGITDEQLQSLKVVIGKYCQKYLEHIRTNTEVKKGRISASRVLQEINVIVMGQLEGKEEKELIICVKNETALLKECLEKQNFALFSKISKSEETLKQQWRRNQS